MSKKTDEALDVIFNFLAIFVVFVFIGACAGAAVKVFLWLAGI